MGFESNPITSSLHLSSIINNILLWIFNIIENFSKNAQTFAEQLIIKTGKRCENSSAQSWMKGYINLQWWCKSTRGYWITCDLNRPQNSEGGSIRLEVDPEIFAGLAKMIAFRRYGRGKPDESKPKRDVLRWFTSKYWAGGGRESAHETRISRGRGGKLGRARSPRDRTFRVALFRLFREKAAEKSGFRAGHLQGPSIRFRLRLDRHVRPFLWL